MIRKVLILDEGYGSSIYGGAIANGFKSLDIEVIHHSWSKVIRSKNSNSLFLNYLKFESKFSFGVSMMLLNSEIIKIATKEQPELILIYRGIHIYPGTLRKIKRASKAKVFSYNNDDPFSPRYPCYYWRHFKKGLRHYDHVFAYREHNIRDYRNIGVQSVSLLRSYYIKDTNFPIENSKNEIGCDVVFVGHYEDDGRDDYLLYLLESGIDLKIFGTDWHRSNLYFQIVEKLGSEIVPLYAQDYNEAINSAKIALVFLSKLNRDTYTRRCFEIPATKTMMLSEYTDDLAGLFEQGREIDFFYTVEELDSKIHYYLENFRYQKVGAAAYARLIKGDHEVTDRCREIIQVYCDLVESSQ